MSRPHKCRRVRLNHRGVIFKPRGIPLRRSEMIELQLDELEALRQAHLQGKTQEEGAEALGISRSTFGRILESAHRKLADALVNCKALSINGGPVIMDKRHFECRACGHTWEEPYGTGRPNRCPSCNSNNIYRTDAGAHHWGHGRGGGRGMGQGRHRMGYRASEREETGGDR